MTLCIAAACQHKGEPRIVMAADARIEGDFAGAEIAFKHAWLTFNWPLMYADSVSDAHALIRHYHRALGNARLTADNVYSALQGPAEDRKVEMIDHHVRMKLGVSYPDFLEHGREWFSDGLLQETEHEIRSISLKCYLLTVGFIAGIPRLFTIAPDGQVYENDHFAAIGTGYAVAESVFYQREQHRHEQLERTIYTVFEAAKLGRTAPGVGQKKLTLIVMGPPDDDGAMEWWTLNKSGGIEKLEQAFAVYGPKSLDGFAAIEQLDDVISMRKKMPTRERLIEIARKFKRLPSDLTRTEDPA